MPADVVVAGVYSNPAVEGPRWPDDEYVVLANIGDSAADLRGWSLTNRKRDGADHYRYMFPRFLSNGDPWELQPGALAFVHTGRGTNGATASAGEAHQVHLFEHRLLFIWRDSGDTVCLYDRNERLIHSYSLHATSRQA